MSPGFEYKSNLPFQNLKLCSDILLYRWLGGLSVDPIQWDFGSNPLNLTVDSRGTVTWDYSFNESVSWSESAVFSTSSGPWGKVYYDLNLNESGNLLTTANDRDLVCMILYKDYINKNSPG